MKRVLQILPYCCLGLLVGTSPLSNAFTPTIISSKPTRNRSATTSTTTLGVSIAPGSWQQQSIDDDFVQDPNSYALTKEEAKPILTLGKGESEKIINAFGIWCAVVSVITGPIWMMAMSLVNALNSINEGMDPNKAIYDRTGKVWSKTWLTMTDCYPTISGHVDQLKESTGPCLYVANHASWMDIPVLCTVLDPVFKFIAKGELRKVPCIGQQLSGGDHILIDRDDRKSQLRTFKEGIAWLKKGVPIMAFPEGMRSKDGRLMEFKKGLFSLAVKMNVPIIPITISHTHAIMPSYALFPIQNGAGKVHVHVNEAISSEGRTEAELEELVRKAFCDTLPASQLPLDYEKDTANKKVIEPKAAELQQA